MHQADLEDLMSKEHTMSHDISRKSFEDNREAVQKEINNIVSELDVNIHVNILK